MSVLRQSGLIESVRGRGGGYALARPASQISVEEVLQSLGEPLFATNYCESHPGVLAVCSHHGNCSIRSVWQVLGEMIHRVLRGTSLADLCMEEQRLSTRMKDTIEPALLNFGRSTSGDSSFSPAGPARPK
jgi:Rrf2 family iron-sulfur cluster assembly transcriptional regulator